jgi:hypothetical protein
MNDALPQHRNGGERSSLGILPDRDRASGVVAWDLDAVSVLRLSEPTDL